MSSEDFYASLKEKLILETILMDSFGNTGKTGSKPEIKKKIVTKGLW